MKQFNVPTLKASSVITHRFEVIKDSRDALVIGRKVLNALGLIPNFNDNIYRLNAGRTGVDCDASDLKEPQVDAFLNASNEAADNAIKPEDLLPDHLDEDLAQQYLQLLVKHQHYYDPHAL
ncbi:hypothetical protein PInf_000654 [Phytophthora infestans]|nr:hypothetical protein PInf_000654 [Phytophthora infestans]